MNAMALVMYATLMAPVSSRLIDAVCLMTLMKTDAEESTVKYATVAGFTTFGDRPVRSRYRA